MTPAVFLDRDNTIIYNEGDLGDPDLVELTRGAASAIASLRGLGYKIVVVTNQGGVARGRYTEEDVHAVHRRINELIKASANGAGIDAFYYCPYSPNGNLKQYKKDHENRKPNPGMLLQAAEELKLNLGASWMIGDQLVDVQAGHRAGTRTILLREDADSLRPMQVAELSGVTSETPDADRPVSPDFFASGLIEACRIIAQQRKPESGEDIARARVGGGKRWDATKIAALQRPRIRTEDDLDEQAEKPPRKAGRAFRPWGATDSVDEEKPIVAKPFRKKFFKENEDSEEGQTAVDSAAPYFADPASAVTMPQPVPDPDTKAQPAAPKASPPPTEEPARRDIPENIRKAIEAKKARELEQEQNAPVAAPAPPGPEKTLRLILQELRTQRNATAEFSYLTIVAIVLQLIAVICLLGALWMGGPDDALFLRWIAVAVMAQLMVIATMQFGR